MAHQKTPDWFYPDELEFEAGMCNVLVYPHPDEEQAGTLVLQLDNGDKEEYAPLRYTDVMEMYLFLGEWLNWAVEQGYEV